MNATGYHTDAKCCHAGAKWLDCAGLRFSLHHGRLEQPSRVRRITPLPATSCHDCANLLFDARYPFILRPKPSINIKISIDNGSFDYSERCVRGNGCEVQPFHGTGGWTTRKSADNSTSVRVPCRHYETTARWPIRRLTTRCFTSRRM